MQECRGELGLETTEVFVCISSYGRLHLHSCRNGFVLGVAALAARDLPNKSAKRRLV